MGWDWLGISATAGSFCQVLYQRQTLAATQLCMWCPSGYLRRVRACSICRCAVAGTDDPALHTKEVPDASRVER